VTGRHPPDQERQPRLVRPRQPAATGQGVARRAVVVRGRFSGLPAVLFSGRHALGDPPAGRLARPAGRCVPEVYCGGPAVRWMLLVAACPAGLTQVREIVSPGR
jgi:hypothetical protein